MEASGRKKKKREEWEQGGGGDAVERREYGEVEYRGAMLPPYENVFIWPMTDGRCCQPGSGSHCLTVTEA